MGTSHGASTNTTVTLLPFSSENTSQDINQMIVSGFSPPRPSTEVLSSARGINSSLPPPPQEVSLFTLPGTPVVSSTFERGKAVKKKRANPPPLTRVRETMPPSRRGHLPPLWHQPPRVVLQGP